MYIYNQLAMREGIQVEKAVCKYFDDNNILAVRMADQDSTKDLDLYAGVDVIAVRGDDIVPIQVKSSIVGLRDSVTKSGMHDRFIPVVVGVPNRDEDPDEVFDALEFEGVFFSSQPSTRDRMSVLDDITGVRLVSPWIWRYGEYDAITAAVASVRANSTAAL